jgi:hypothetical protein
MGYFGYSPHKATARIRKPKCIKGVFTGNYEFHDGLCNWEVQLESGDLITVSGDFPDAFQDRINNLELFPSR